MNAMFSIILPVFLPFVFAVIALMRGRKSASGVLLTGAFVHLAACVAGVIPSLVPGGDSLLFPQGIPGFYAMLDLNSDSKLFMILISFLFLIVSVFFVNHDKMMKSDGRHPSFRQSVFCAVMLAFLGSMALVLAARNLGLLWVAVEATTLFSAPLIIYYRSGRAMEAMWKYLLQCSVGIGFALFGTLLVACSVPAGTEPGLALDSLAQMELDPMLFKLGFVFIIAGYGTKADLAPFHNWIPDTYSEAPGPVSALVSGTLLNASFLALIRILDIAPAGAVKFCNQLIMVLGFLSLAMAAFFVIRQYDCKRMLGYSSIEHMGIAMLMTCAGLHNLAICHLFCHALFKSGLFMTAENISFSCGTRRIEDIRGIFSSSPLRAVLWLGGIILICGMPPGPLFFTEYTLISTLKDGQAILLIVLLFLIFAGMLHTALRMVSGRETPAKVKVGKVMDIPALILTVAAVTAGTVIYILTAVQL